jgi:cysteinyl-tRNA synthetase
MELIINTSNMQIFNSLTSKLEPVEKKDKPISIYSCGPTVYDNVHIGNLFSFIAADQLRRALLINDYEVTHVMNTTDVDDKTIKRALADYSDHDTMEALLLLTAQFEAVFVDDAEKVGIGMRDIELVRATEHIPQMQELIRQLLKLSIAYIADDGIYFSIEAYKKSHQYGVLTNITENSTGKARVDNDEYDKENIHDFALWKLQSDGEPSWDFMIDGKQMSGRPGWHIECSAMSTHYLGQPFDIHTGGIDLKFPHHENEIAQSSGAYNLPFATSFMHNEHVLVDNKKMAKSAGNFFSLRDIEKKGIEPIAFRVLALQSHYRHQLNFSWGSLVAAQSFLHGLYHAADLRYQSMTEVKALDDVFTTTSNDIAQCLANDLDTPGALAAIAGLMNELENSLLNSEDVGEFIEFLEFVDAALGLNLSEREDITYEQKQIIADRESARDAKDFAAADTQRDRLLSQGVSVRDTKYGPIWSRV